MLIRMIHVAAIFLSTNDMFNISAAKWEIRWTCSCQGELSCIQIWTKSNLSPRQSLLGPVMITFSDEEWVDAYKSYKNVCIGPVTIEENKYWQPK